MLIVNSLQLSAQIWFDKNLWPDGYAFLDSFGNIPIIRKLVGGGDSFAKEDIFAASTDPRRIIVNGGGAREVYCDGENYKTALTYAGDVINSFKENGADAKKISYEQWQNLFKGKSIYIDLGYNADASHLNSLYSASSSQGKFDGISSASGFIITPDSVTNSCSIAVCDNSDKSVTEYTFRHDCSKLIQYIEESTYQKPQNDTFAFEINLDYTSYTSENVEQTVELSPFVLVSVSAENGLEKNIVSESIFKNMSDLEHFAEASLQYFGYTPSLLRKTVQNNKSVVYVENNATISYYFDGTVEYSALSSKRGLRKSTSTNNCSQAVNDVLKLVGELCEEAEIRKDSFNLHLTSNLCDNRENKYTVKFENTFNGTVINYGNGDGNAVSATVDDGYITEFKIHLANFSESDNGTRPPPMLYAIDLLSAESNGGTLIIDDIYKCFDCTNPGEASIKWAFKIKNSDTVKVINVDKD